MSDLVMADNEIAKRWARPGYGIETEEQAVAWCEKALAELKRARFQCDVAIPDPRQTLEESQRSKYLIWLMRWAGFAATIAVLHRVKKLSDQQFDRLKKEGEATAVVSVFGLRGTE